LREIEDPHHAGDDAEPQHDQNDDRAEAEEQTTLIREATSEQSQVVLDVETSTWGLPIGPHRSREDADAAQVRLEEAGFTATVIDLTTPVPRVLRPGPIAAAKTFGHSRGQASSLDVPADKTGTN